MWTAERIRRLTATSSGRRFNAWLNLIISFFTSYVYSFFLFTITSVKHITKNLSACVTYILVFLKHKKPFVCSAAQRYLPWASVEQMMYWLCILLCHKVRVCKRSFYVGMA